MSPDSGEILIGGHSVQREGDQVRKIIGVCPQDLALYPELSATDNLTFFGKMAGLSGREADEQSRVILGAGSDSATGPKTESTSSPAA